MGMAQKHLRDCRSCAERLDRAKQELRAAIWAAVESGESYRDIAEFAGISHTRVGELYREEKLRREAPTG
jgi:hypothetical protein